MAGHTRRFNPSHQWINKKIRAGELKLQQMDVQTYFFRRKNLNALGQPRSWTDHLLWHHAAHTVDLFAYPDAFPDEWRAFRVARMSDLMGRLGAAVLAFVIAPRLAQRFELAAVHVFDPAEVELPNIGLARFRNLSAGGGFTLDTADARLRRDYNTSQCQKHDTLRAMFARVGVQLVECPTTLDDLPFSA